MKNAPSLTWTAHQYGGGYETILAPGISLTVELTMLREEKDTPYRWRALGMQSKGRFETLQEAQSSAERFAAKTLRAALARFPSNEGDTLGTG